jgi:transposase-like protein
MQERGVSVNHSAWSYSAEHGTVIAIPQVKDLNNLAEQDHCAVKRIIRPMLGLKSL